MTQRSKHLWDSLIERDPYLEPFRAVLKRRLCRIQDVEKRLTGGRMSLPDFAAGHEYYGLHFEADRWVFREWAPNATAIYLIGEMTGWRELPAYALKRTDDSGIWEVNLPENRLSHGNLYRLRIHWPDGNGDRIPAYARRVVQDSGTNIFNAQVWHPGEPYRWRYKKKQAPHDDPPLIYEAHVGMAQNVEGVGTYREFADLVLPRIVAAGYNTLQLMAIQEHPYYGSFGYHVANFFAASSRFGTPEDLKFLIDSAHQAGLTVIMDLIHSHAVNNQVEGLSHFDGTPYQYFHAGSRGSHLAWDSRCFDYGKIQVLHFLLSNCRYWLDEYRFDGFRFDGITSMLYDHHGLGEAFTSYEQYFSEHVDEDALTYLALANRVVHGVRPEAVTIAEDISGMPGLAAPAGIGGIGFDYRMAMGVPDYWIRLIKDTQDEDWHMGNLWYELTNRRPDEKTVSYAESHDQALVGDQTLIFRLIGADMYDHMRADEESMRVDRGIAIHKMIRLITLATAGNGYLNFMGNEFGHPEWIDFPREGNGWSYRYARRQWHLMDDNSLRYRFLAEWDRAMIALFKDRGLLGVPEIYLYHEHNDNKVLAMERGGLVFVFNFHPTRSHVDYRIFMPPGKYRMVLDTDEVEYGGHARLTAGQEHFTQPVMDRYQTSHFNSLYLPNRAAMVLEKEVEKEKRTGKRIGSRQKG